MHRPDPQNQARATGRADALIVITRNRLVMQYLSLGSSCDVALQLKRRGKQKENNFFDFIWNEVDGLSAVTHIISNDFQGLCDINNYEKKRYASLNGIFNINTLYPNVVFMHNKVIDLNEINSFSRKIIRTKSILSSLDRKIFIYYRHIRRPITQDFSKLLTETLQFVEMYKTKYNSNFTILSLFVVGPMFDQEIIKEQLAFLQLHNTENIKFDFTYRRNDKDKELNKIAQQRWTELFTAYL